MARVHCPDCEMAVVLDPHGRCPEGHDLGNAGQRIAQLLADPTPHPDEPQPWVGAIDVPAAAPTLAAAEPAQPERQIRPVSIGVDAADLEDTATAEDGLNELHELHAFDEMFDAHQSPATPQWSAPHAASTPAPSASTAPPVAPAPSAPPVPAPASQPSGSALPPFAAAPQPAAPQPAAPQPAASQPAAPQPPASQPAAGGSTVPARTERPREGDGAGEPKPFVRRNVPAARTEADMSAIAELTALLDGPPPAAPEAAAGAPSDEHLATVSELPLRPPGPDVDPAGGAGTAGVEPSSQAANGEDLDWGHFTARGRRRRFGR